MIVQMFFQQSASVADVAGPSRDPLSPPCSAELVELSSCCTSSGCTCTSVLGVLFLQERLVALPVVVLLLLPTSVAAICLCIAYTIGGGGGGGGGGDA
eukprot:6463836-Amphidinium_carterae.6